MVDVVATDGTRLHVAVHGGSGPPVVLLHGLSCTGAMWDGVVAALGSSRRIVVPELRGHGGSVPVVGGLGLDQQADDVRSVLEALDLHDVVLVGHSAGGYAALAFARRHPDVAGSRLRRIVTLGTAGTLTHWRERMVLRFAASRVFYGALSRPGLGHRLVRRGAFGRAPDPAAVEWTRRMARACPRAVKSAWVAAIAGTSMQSGLASHLAVPVTSSTGSEDATVTPARATELASACGPLGSVVILEGAGHMAPLEQPEAVADLIG